ncbi:MAG: hypothetical protein K8U57_37330 [Planctomycetes bacterium]|nr:hypothetical protein [Planctomycetota bacterium]
MFRTTVGAGLLFLSIVGTARAAGEPPVIDLPDTASGFPEYVSPTAGIARPFPPDIVPVLPAPTPLPKQPSNPATDFLNDRFSTPFTTQTAGGGFQGRSYNEEFDGDFGGIFFAQKVQVGVTIQQQQIGTTSTQVQTGTTTTTIIDPKTQRPITVVTPIFTTVTTPVFRNVPVPVFRDVQTILAGRYSGIMITDNDSPRPSNRVYFGYSYYDGLGAAQNPGFGDVTQNRQIFGIEQTLFNGNTSIGLRMPYVQVAGPFGSGGNAAGDLSILGKWALINNRDTGDILSIGMVLTTPTGGQAGVFPDGSPIPHSVLFQPWLGAVHTMGRGYIQGITNVVIPSDSRDVLLFGHSFALGYQLIQGSGVVPTVTPTFETHIRLPLNDRNPNGLIYLQDQVNLTGGAHFRWNRFTMSGAACIPVVGPRPWNIEALANVNYRF